MLSGRMTWKIQILDPTVLDRSKSVSKSHGCFVVFSTVFIAKDAVSQTSRWGRIWSQLHRADLAEVFGSCSRVSLMLGIMAQACTPCHHLHGLVASCS